jgi:hypothetical protein
MQKRLRTGVTTYRKTELDVKKFLTLGPLVEFVRHVGQLAVRLQVVPSVLCDWCLCLKLLVDNLVESVFFEQQTSPKRVEVILGTDCEYRLSSEHDRIVIVLSRRDLEYVLRFLLEYYRDGAAAVDHVDLQTPDGDYVTILVQEFIPPMSSAEARRRLKT